MFNRLLFKVKFRYLIFICFLGLILNIKIFFISLFFISLKLYLSSKKSKSIILHSQVYVKAFYKSLNFKCYGEEFSEDGITHIAMKYEK